MMLDIPPNARLLVGVEGSPIGARIVPHKTNGDLLVLKSSNQEGGPALANMAGCQPSKSWRGREFWSCTVRRTEFLEGLKAVAVIALAAAKPTKVQADFLQ